MTEHPAVLPDPSTSCLRHSAQDDTALSRVVNYSKPLKKSLPYNDSTLDYSKKEHVKSSVPRFNDSLIRVAYAWRRALCSLKEAFKEVVALVINEDEGGADST